MRDPNLQNSPLHATGGPISVEHFGFNSPLVDIFLEAARELNYLHPENDMNGFQQTGFARPHGSLRNGLRCSTAKAYLRPTKHRQNLHISLESRVEKILVHKANKTAYGCIFSNSKGDKYVVFARKEVILSAGAIQSPQLLKLSGIGPQHELLQHQIDVIFHSPGVGENLQDHVSAGGNTYLIENPINDQTLSFIGPKVLQVNSTRQFVFDKSGPLYGNPFCEVMAFISTKLVADSAYPDWPDVQIYFSAMADNSDGGMFGKRAGGISDTFYNEVFEPILYRDSWMAIPLLMRPKSRGRILLANADPYAAPLIYPNYFAERSDIETLIEASKFIRKFAETNTMQFIKSTFNPHLPPACKQFEQFSDDFFECLARFYTQTIYHPVGTCKMGPKHDR